jgi:hypothetical protein
VTSGADAHPTRYTSSRAGRYSATRNIKTSGLSLSHKWRRCGKEREHVSWQYLYFVKIGAFLPTTSLSQTHQQNMHYCVVDDNVAELTHGVKDPPHLTSCPYCRQKSQSVVIITNRYRIVVHDDDNAALPIEMYMTKVANTSSLTHKISTLRAISMNFAISAEVSTNE